MINATNDCLLQLMLHFNHPLLQFADLTDPLLSTEHCCIVFQTLLS